MTADDRPQKACQQHQRSDVEACLPLDLIADLSGAFDDDDGLQAGPLVAFLQPVDVMDDGGGSGRDAPVIAIDGLDPADPGVCARRGCALSPESRGVVALLPL